jgi:hypothetical protein
MSERKRSAAPRAVAATVAGTGRDGQCRAGQRGSFFFREVGKNKRKGFLDGNDFLGAAAKQQQQQKQQQKQQEQQQQEQPPWRAVVRVL